jgi:dTDP-4-dehydrorhamnose 3,5-epimerase
MKFREFEVPDLKLLVPRQFSDARGSFSEIWIDRWFRAEIADVTFVQENHAASARKGTVRGLHFQKPPAAQGKLVRVIRGSVFDVTVDIRQGSPSYGKHVTTRLDAVEGAQLWGPPGFLHGYCTLEDETEVYYKSLLITAPAMMRGFSGTIRNSVSIGRSSPIVPCFPIRTSGIQCSVTCPTISIIRGEYQILLHNRPHKSLSQSTD